MNARMRQQAPELVFISFWLPDCFGFNSRGRGYAEQGNRYRLAVIILVPVTRTHLPRWIPIDKTRPAPGNLLPFLAALIPSALSTRAIPLWTKRSNRRSFPWPANDGVEARAPGRVTIRSLGAEPAWIPAGKTSRSFSGEDCSIEGGAAERDAGPANPASSGIEALCAII